MLELELRRLELGLGVRQGTKRLGTKRFGYEMTGKPFAAVSASVLQLLVASAASSQYSLLKQILHSSRVRPSVIIPSLSCVSVPDLLYIN